MASIEVIFTGIQGFPSSGKELLFSIREDNSVGWRTNPSGEQGRSLPFEDLAEAERFARGYAARLHFQASPEAVISKGGK